MFKDHYRSAMSFKVPDDLIAGTARKMKEAAIRQNYSQKKPFRRIVWKRATAIAAALYLLFISGAAFYVGKQNFMNSPAIPEAAMSSAGSDRLSNNADSENGLLLDRQPMEQKGGYSEELPKIEAVSYMASEARVLFTADLSDLEQSENPWTEEVAIKELPVFLVADEEDNNLSESDTKEIVCNAAKTLQTEISSVPSPGFDEGNYMALCQDGSQISVTQNGTVQISNLAVNRPSIEITGTTARQVGLKAAKYWYGVYESFYQFKIPDFSLLPQENLQNGTSYAVRVYDTGGSISDQIISYNLFSGTITVGEEKVIESFTYPAALTTQPLGYYPLISVEDAKQILLSERYAKEILPDISLSLQDIEDISLVYWTDTEYQQPVYRFLVSLDGTDISVSSNSSEEKAYGEYFVPAVSPKYWI